MLYSDRPGIYGAEQHNHMLSLALVSAGHRLTFVQPPADHHLIRERERLGIRHRWLEPDDMYDLSRPARTLLDAEEPRRILAGEAPELVIFSDSSPFANLKARHSAAEMGIPHLSVVHCVNPDWEHDYAPYLDELALVYQEARTVIAVSRANLELLQRSFGLPHELGEVIHSGRPQPFFAPRDPGARARIMAEFEIPEGALINLTVARLEFSKGYQYLLDAMVLLQHCPDWPRMHFLWVGSGTLEPRLRNMVKLLGCQDQIHFLGVRQDITDLLDAADTFVLPSQFEGMPLVILEAMAKGLPVIATDVGGTAEALDGTGILLPDPRRGTSIRKELAEAICHLTADGNQREALGQAAQIRAQTHFRAEQMITAYVNRISEVLDAV